MLCKTERVLLCANSLVEIPRNTTRSPIWLLGAGGSYGPAYKVQRSAGLEIRSRPSGNVSTERHFLDTLLGCVLAVGHEEQGSIWAKRRDQMKESVRRSMVRAAARKGGLRGLNEPGLILVTPDP